MCLFGGHLHRALPMLMHQKTMINCFFVKRSCQWPIYDFFKSNRTRKIFDGIGNNINLYLTQIQWIIYFIYPGFQNSKGGHTDSGGITEETTHFGNTLHEPCNTTQKGLKPWPLVPTKWWSSWRKMARKPLSKEDDRVFGKKAKTRTLMVRQTTIGPLTGGNNKAIEVKQNHFSILIVILLFAVNENAVQEVNAIAFSTNRSISKDNLKVVTKRPIGKRI